MERQKQRKQKKKRIVGNDKLYIKHQVIVDFTPVRKSKNRRELRDRLILPTFNNDGKHYTFGFVIPSSPAKCEDQFREDHEKRVIQSDLEISEIMVPKPKTKYRYCGVCKGHYEEYKDHIEGQLHKQNISKSQFQAYIKETCGEYQRADYEQSSQENLDKLFITQSNELKKYQDQGHDCCIVL